MADARQHTDWSTRIFEVSVTLTVEGRDEADVDTIARRVFATAAPVGWRIDRTDAMTYEELEEDPWKRKD